MAKLGIAACAAVAAPSSGCSAYVARPAWQHGKDCAKRTIADVSAVADNVAVYDDDYGGWLTTAGTSIAAPLIAGVYALAGNAAACQRSVRRHLGKQRPHHRLESR